MTLPLRMLHARYAAELGVSVLAVGSTVALLPACREVRIDGRTLCTVPVAIPSLVVQLHLATSRP